MRKKTNNLIFPLLVMGVFLVCIGSCKKDDVPKIGSSYAGGIVFYTDGAGHGLVCAETDLGYKSWGCNGTPIGGTSEAINTGAANTNAIVSGCTEAGIAAKLCYDLSLNGYTDWYLPSLDELHLMYKNLHTQGLGHFGDDIYWSSSEGSYYHAWSEDFYSGDQNIDNKYTSNWVRAVRAF